MRAPSAEPRAQGPKGPPGAGPCAAGGGGFRRAFDGAPGEGMAEGGPPGLHFRATPVPGIANPHATMSFESFDVAARCSFALGSFRSYALRSSWGLAS